MSMDSNVEVKAREVNGCIILDITAENFTYPQTSVLKGHTSRLIEQGHRYFVLNLTDVRVVDSFGLATVISVLKMIREHGGGLSLYGLNEMFARLVEVTHLDRVLEVWPTEAQATYYLETTMKHSSHR